MTGGQTGKPDDASQPAVKRVEARRALGDIAAAFAAAGITEDELLEARGVREELSRK